MVGLGQGEPALWGEARPKVRCPPVNSTRSRVWLPVYKTWRLNEKSYGQLQGLDKKMTAEKYGDEQVRLWRRAFDVRPPALEMNDPKSPRMDPRYAELTDDQIPLTEALCDTIDRVMPYYEDHIMKAFETHDQAYDTLSVQAYRSRHTQRTYIRHTNGHGHTSHR